MRVTEQGLVLGQGNNVSVAPPWTRTVAASLEAWRRPGAVTLLCGPRQSALELLKMLGDVLSIEPASVTEAALGEAPAASANEVVTRLDSQSLLFDVEMVCWSPWLQLDPIRFLRQYARRHGVMAVWPGSVSGGFVHFSAPDRRDYVRADARGLSVMRPVPTRFPDEVPFVIERIPA
jgi:hypothetical protein